MSDSARQIVRNGEWQVPPAERPANWRGMGVPCDPWAEKVVITEYLPAAVTVLPQTTFRVTLPLLGWATAVDILRCRCGRPEGHRGYCFWRVIIRDARIERIAKASLQIRRAIRKSAKSFGADSQVHLAAEVLVLGLWTRVPWEIRTVLKADSKAPIEEIAKRYVTGKLWKHNKTVHFGKMDPKEGDIEFWLYAMVGAGVLKISWDKNGEPLLSV